MSRSKNVILATAKKSISEKMMLSIDVGGESYIKGEIVNLCVSGNSLASLTEQSEIFLRLLQVSIIGRAKIFTTKEFASSIRKKDIDKSVSEIRAQTANFPIENLCNTYGASYIFGCIHRCVFFTDFVSAAHWAIEGVKFCNKKKA